jgi:glucose/arabinose dehydrogenase
MSRANRAAATPPLRFRPCLQSLEERLTPAALPAGFTENVVAAGLSGATAMEIAPDGRIWVLEQGGDVEVFRPGSTAGWNALDLPAAAISAQGERGLLGIAFAPDYDIATPAPDHVYLYYTSTQAPNPHNRVSRFTVDNTNPNQPSLGNETVILDLDPLSGATNHNGGAIHFGPDGNLYVAVGDNAAGANAQSLNTRHGKILRINPDGTIPGDNPTSFDGLAGTPTGVNRAIWAVGLRNPFTFTFQPGSGLMFINDVGAGSFEEINRGQAGANYGWPDTEGNFDANLFPDFTNPFYSYAHGGGTFEGFAITGGAFYNPAAPGPARFPVRFTGDYFFADFVNDWINVIDRATKTVTRFATGASAPVDLRVGADGSLYYLSRGNGQVLRVRFTLNQAPSITRQPRSQAAPQGLWATFVVRATGPGLTYQWQRAEEGTSDWIDIAGATRSSFTLENLQPSDSGDRFRVVVVNAFGTATSNAATLTVAAPVAGFRAGVNFQTSASQGFAGYLRDVGGRYRRRPSGFAFGWNVNNFYARDRNAARAPDERFDTFNHMQKPANPKASWQIRVPNGTYLVRLVAGDAAAFDSVYQINVEGKRIIDGTPTAGNRWLENTIVVTVTDRRLTVKSAAKAVRNKIAFIDIARVS